VSKKNRNRPDRPDRAGRAAERRLPVPINADAVPLLEQLDAAFGEHHSMNGYRCLECDVTELTIDLDLGMTPKGITCWRCGRRGAATSLQYPREDLPLEALPQQEFYRPTRAQYDTLTTWEKDWVRRGGLLHRPFTATRPGAYTHRGRAARPALEVLA
jgi:hypothetical protein